jgi:hypothetical protein
VSEILFWCVNVITLLLFSSPRQTFWAVTCGEPRKKYIVWMELLTDSVRYVKQKSSYNYIVTLLPTSHAILNLLN